MHGSRRTIRLTAAALLVTTLLATALTGCTAEERARLNNVPVSAHPDASATPTPPAPNPGDTLTDAQAAAIRKSLPKNGDSVYTTTAGVNIMINSHELLPHAVKADAEAQLVAAAQAAPASNDAMNPNLAPVIKRVSASVGKPVVVIVKIRTGNDAGDAKPWRLAIPGPAAKPGQANGFPDSASAVASARKYIKEQPRTTKWDVLVAGH